MPRAVIKRRTKLVVGSTHTLLGPVTVYTVVELRRVPNKRGTTSTVPVWRGCCTVCGGDFDYARVISPSVRRCGRCRGVKTEIVDISPDVSVDRVNRAARKEMEEKVLSGVNSLDAYRDVMGVHEPVSTSHTKPVFTDR